jgi:hypothetical protein
MNACFSSFRNHLSKYHPTLAVHLVKMAKLRRVIATTEQIQLSIRDLSQVSHTPSPSHPSPSALNIGIIIIYTRR